MKAQLDYTELLNRLPKEIRDEILTLPEDEKYEVLQEIAMNEGTPIEAEDNETIYSESAPLVVNGGKIRYLGGDTYHISGRKHNDKKRVGSGIKIFAEEGSIVYSDKLKIGYGDQPGPVEIMGKNMKGKTYHDVATMLARAAKKVEDKLESLPKVDQIALDSAQDMLIKIDAERDKLNHNLLKIDLPVKEQEEEEKERLKRFKLEMAQNGKVVSKAPPMGIMPIELPTDVLRSGVENPYDRYLRIKEPEPMSFEDIESMQKIIYGDDYKKENYFEEAVASIIDSEGAFGDDVTNTITGPFGLTRGGLSLVGDKRDPREIPPDEARTIIRKILDAHEKRLATNFKDYYSWDPTMKKIVLDFAYNLGGVSSFPKMKEYLKQKDFGNAFLETLDVITVNNGYGSKGLAKRRAELFNKAAVQLGLPHILEVTQPDKKGLFYKLSDNSMIKVTPKKGMDESSKVGTIKIKLPKKAMYGGMTPEYNYMDFPFYTENIPEAKYGMNLKRYQTGGTALSDERKQQPVVIPPTPQLNPPAQQLNLTPFDLSPQQGALPRLRILTPQGYQAIDQFENTSGTFDASGRPTGMNMSAGYSQYGIDDKGKAAVKKIEDYITNNIGEYTWSKLPEDIKTLFYDAAFNSTGNIEYFLKGLAQAVQQSNPAAKYPKGETADDYRKYRNNIPTDEAIRIINNADFSNLNTSGDITGNFINILNQQRESIGNRSNFPETYMPTYGRRAIDVYNNFQNLTSSPTTQQPSNQPLPSTTSTDNSVGLRLKPLPLDSRFLDQSTRMALTKQRAGIATMAPPIIENESLKENEPLNYYQTIQSRSDNNDDSKKAPFDYKSITNNLAEAAYVASLLGERVQAPPRFQLDAVNPFMNMEFIDPSRAAQRQLGSTMAALNYGTRGSGSNTGNQIAAMAQIADKMGDVAYQAELARNEFENQKMQGTYQFENQLREGNLQLAMQTAAQTAQALENKRQQSNAAIQKLISDANMARTAKEAYNMMISQECYKLDSRGNWVYNPDCAKIQFAKEMANIQNTVKSKETTPQQQAPAVNYNYYSTPPPDTPPPAPPATSGKKYGGKLKRPTYVSPKYM